MLIITYSKNIIFDHSECIISLFNPHNVRFVVENFGLKIKTDYICDTKIDVI